MFDIDVSCDVSMSMTMTMPLGRGGVREEGDGWRMAGDCTRSQSAARSK